MAAQALDRPAQRVGGRLVSRDEHRDELVADLGVRHRAAVLVARLHHQREHVGALLEVGVGLGDRDQLVEHHVDLRAQALELAPRRPRPEVPAQLAATAPRAGRARPARDQLFQRLQARALGAEHRAQDRPQRDPLHRAARPRTRRPAGQLSISARGDLRDHRLVGLHALALERRQQQLALLHVLRFVDAQQRVRSEQFAQRARRPGVQHGRIGFEGLLDQRRIRHRHRRAEAVHVHA